MVLIGLDVASYKTGFFVLDIETIQYKIGTIEAKGNNPYDRIRQIHNKSKSLLEKYNPDIIIIESTYLDSWNNHKKGKSRKRGNVDTLKILEKVHGAIISNTKDWQDIVYLPPSEHKLTLTGMGNATKQSTIWAIQKKLGVGNISDDEGDAAALVLTFLVKRKQWEVLEKIKNKYQN